MTDMVVDLARSRIEIKCGQKNDQRWCIGCMTMDGAGLYSTTPTVGGKRADDPSSEELHRTVSRDEPAALVQTPITQTRMIKGIEEDEEGRAGGEGEEMPPVLLCNPQ